MGSGICDLAYVLVDLYWVASLGTDAVAAVAVSGNLTFAVLAITQMLGVGTTTLVAHATGRKEHDQARVVFNEAQWLSIVAGSVFFVVAMALRVRYADALSADADTARLAGSYLLWFTPAMALQFALVAMGAALRGTGNFKPGMVVQIATVVINMVLAPILVFGWGTGYAFGIAGAAIATVVAVVVGVTWLGCYFVAPDAYLRFQRPSWPPRWRLWRQLLGIGLPAGAEFGLLTVYLLLVYTVTRPFGAAAQAGFGIGLRVIQACFLPVVALGFAVSPVAGQNFGAGKGARVRQTFTVAASLAAASMLVLAIATRFFSAAMVGVFSTDPTVIAVGDEYLQIVAWTFVASGVIFVSSSMFQAMGNTLPALFTSSARIVIVSVPILLLSRRADFALHWIWYLSAGSVLLQMVMNLLLLRREFRQRLVFEAA